MTPHRNDPCPCGSGRKYKNCHGAAGAKNPLSGRSGRLVALFLLAGAIVAILAVTRDGGGSGTAPPGPAPPGKVWSAEHGHWHDAP